MILVDTNIIMRHLLNDDKEQSLKLFELIENDEVLILNEVILECVYVLNKVYKLNRTEIYLLLSQLLNTKNINSNLNILINTLKFYQSSSLDFVDCILISNNHLLNYKVVSFDKKLNAKLI